MSAADAIRDALLAGERLTADDLPKRFGVTSGNLKPKIRQLEEAGYTFRAEVVGGRKFFQLDLRPSPGAPTPTYPMEVTVADGVSQEAGLRRTPLPTRVQQPQPGDILTITGLYLAEDGGVEAQARGADGTYLLRVAAHHRAGGKKWIAAIGFNLGSIE